MTFCLVGESKAVSAAVSCLQDGTLFPLLWTLVMGELLGLQESSGFKVIAYPDYLVLIIEKLS